MKCYYPIEFYTSLLSIFKDNEDKVIAYSLDAKKHGIKILAPNINNSKNEFVILDNETISTGFGSVKGIGDKAIEDIISLQPFENADDFINKIKGTKINKKAIESLAFSGALDEWLEEDETRLDMLKRILIKSGKKFDYDEDYPNGAFSHQDALLQEKLLMGNYFSGHPLDEISLPILWDELDNKDVVTTFAIINNIKPIVTKKGDPMAFISFSFLERDMDGVVFPKVYSKDKIFRKIETQTSKLIRNGLIVKVKGHFSYNNYKDSDDFIVDDIDVPIRINQNRIEEIEESLL